MSGLGQKAHLDGWVEDLGVVRGLVADHAHDQADVLEHLDSGVDEVLDGAAVPAGLVTLDDLEAPTELHVALSRKALQLVEERHDPIGVGALEDDHGVALTLAHAGALDE